ncbi:MAG: TonB-dependent receptor [Bacteroidota bacterium]|nr:TonB-dependent receptor [Bacteroidota bacterium]
MKKFVLVIIFLFSIIVVKSQNITVFDQVSLQAVPDVFIYCNSISVVTNEEGTADFSNFTGHKEIIFQHPSYQKKVKSYSELKKANFKIYLTESPILIKDIVISASGWEQDKRQVPNKIAMINAGQISLQNPQTAADLLGVSGGVFIQKSQYGGGSPMIRGFAANRVLITVDGVRMNNAIFRSGNLQNVISIDAFSVNKTEVIFGAGSVIYGSDAVGGVMNFYTLKPTLSTREKPLIKSNVVSRYASASSEKTSHIDFRLGYKKWAFVSSFTFSDFGNLKMGSNGPDEYLRLEYVERIEGKDSIFINEDPQIQKFTSYQQLNLMQKIRFRPNNNWDFSFASHYSKTSDYARYDRLIRYENSLPRSAQWFYGPQVWAMNNLNITQSSENIFYNKFNLLIAQQHFEESRHDRDFLDVELYHRYEKVDVISANLDFEKKIKDKQRIFYGGEILLNKVGSTGNDENILTKETTPAPSRYPDGSSWNSFAAYLSYWRKINKQFSLQTGLRYNFIDLTSEFDTSFYHFPFTGARLKNDALTGSFGLNYSPVKQWLFKLNLSTAFRAPNIDDMGKVFDSGNGAVVVPNPNLKPEYAYNAELGITRLFSDKVEIDFSIFSILLNSAMVRRNFTLNNQDSILYNGEMSRVQAIQNSAHAFVYGCQADIEAILPFGFGFTSYFNYQKGIEELDDGSNAPLRHAAPAFGTSHLTYTRDKFKADFYINFSGSISYENLAPTEISKPYIYAINSEGLPYSPSWHTINVKLRYQLHNNIMLGFGAENLSNQRYRPYSSGIVAAGRNLIFSVKGIF